MRKPQHWQPLTSIKQIISTLKPYLRWAILGGTLFFLSSALRQHWQGVIELRIHAMGWALLTIALGITLLAHIWSGWVWSWILRELHQPASGVWSVLVYLKTNIAKYLPGNVWHFYGRVLAAQTAGFSTGAATLSVVLEPLLMAAAALSIALISAPSRHWPLQLLSLMVVLVAIHPRFLNPLLSIATRVKQGKGQSTEASPSEAQLPGHNASLSIKRYPWLPLLGEFLFVGLRGIGFLLTVLVLTPVSLSQLPAIFSAFSFAWLLGLVIPGAPGGLGVFEATAMALLQSQLPSAVILGSVALYRLISTLAEASGAGLAWLEERWS